MHDKFLVKLMERLGVVVDEAEERDIKLCFIVCYEGKSGERLGACDGNVPPEHFGISITGKLDNQGEV